MSTPLTPEQIAQARANNLDGYIYMPGALVVSDGVEYQNPDSLVKVLPDGRYQSVDINTGELKGDPYVPGEGYRKMKKYVEPLAIAAFGSALGYGLLNGAGLGATGATGSASGAAGGTSAGLGSAAAFDPLAAYLTTGGVEGSLVGSGVGLGDPLAAYLTTGGVEGSLVGSGVGLGSAGAGVGVGGSLLPNGIPGLNGGSISSLLGGLLGGNSSDWMKLLLSALGGYASYEDAQAPRLQGYTGSINVPTATRTTSQGKYGPISNTTYGYAQGGGIAALAPRYLNTPHDGMEDGIPAHIDGQQPAALSGGEFVVPADVVSHLGNGNSNAGAKQLYEMMDRIRLARTGNANQGQQIEPTKYLPG